MNLVERSAYIRERDSQPITINGATFVLTVQFARTVGYSPDHLRKLAADYPAINEVVTVRDWQFIRVPRHRGDQHAPIYWRMS